MKNHEMKIGYILLLTAILLSACSTTHKATSTSSVKQKSGHPRLLITADQVAEIRATVKMPALFASTLEQAKLDVDSEIKAGIFVPVPKDMAGGYTHERHKKNFFILNKAGYLYQYTQDIKYAEYIKAAFMEYAKLYPTLPKHPTNRSYATGKIFWQCLNDANWLVYCSHAYDCIYNYLSVEERNYLETNLFKPFADFISIENPQFFNRIHNHSTWGNAAVGMIGLVMQDTALVNRALYGIQNDGLDPNMVDNDGGYIVTDGVRQKGFLAQLDYSFSPDGHFTEGPYYLRYAMTPFLLFAKGIDNAMPEFGIFSHRDGIYKKAIYALINQSDHQGRFFPINDAQKGMSWLSREVIDAIDMGYATMGKDPQLLDIALKQGKVALDLTGVKVAQDIDKGLMQTFHHQPTLYTDGHDGDKGGLAILRTFGKDEKELCLLFKYAAQGMGHGHFDRLGISLYDDLGEVVQDYGSARWVNIDQKGGGRYLKENQTFAKQSIAHNTIVINSTSHFNGDVAAGDKDSPTLCFSDVSRPDVQIVSAKEDNAYPNTEMKRTLLLINDPADENPFIVDVYKVKTKEPSTIDFPFWYTGHMLSHNAELTTNSSLTPMGTGHGYQHIWQTAQGNSKENCFKNTWYTNEKFYSKISSLDAGDEIISGMLGANDPEFNLRQDPVLVIRRKNTQQASFISAIESHGRYNPISEIAIHPYPTFTNIKIILDNEQYTVFQIETNQDKSYTICIANEDFSIISKHSIEGKYNWTGPYHYQLNKN